jgi:hypothetical protein
MQTIEIVVRISTPDKLEQKDIESLTTEIEVALKEQAGIPFVEIQWGEV